MGGEGEGNHLGGCSEKYLMPLLLLSYRKSLLFVFVTHADINFLLAIFALIFTFYCSGRNISFAMS